MTSQQSTIIHMFKRGDSICKIATEINLTEHKVKYELSKLRKSGIEVKRWWK